MRVKNTSTYPLEECRELLEFAAMGTRDSGIEVHLKGGAWRGRCYWSIPDVANVADTSTILITIHIPRGPVDNKTTWYSGKRIARLWPDGIPLEDWKDHLVWIAAHEFRHAWQEQRRRRTGRRGKLEYDASKHAFVRLNAWRKRTGRDPVLPVKQANPFHG